MKVSKIFGCVLSLHLCVIAVLLMQPGCQTAQPPTQTHTQDRAVKRGGDSATQTNAGKASRRPGELIPATQMSEGQGLDAAFNAGLESDSMDRSETLEPVDRLEPLDSMSDPQTVDVAGAGYQSYTVKKGDNLWSIAKRYDISLNELYAANDLNKNSVLRVGQQIDIPVESSTATIRPESPDAYQPSGYDQATTTYTVQRGDNLSRIAKRYDTTVRALKAANDKNSDVIRVGETLTVPAGGSTTEARPASTEGAAESGNATKTHTVRSGEYPAQIARQYGMTTKELLAINGISDPRKMRAGQELTVHASGNAANVDSRVETVAEPAAAAPVPVAPNRAAAEIEPNTIRVIEADPLIEGEFNDSESDDVFDNAIEIPVIRMED